MGSNVGEASDCNHLPSTDVTCQLKAYNTHGDSDIAMLTKRTSCDSEAFFCNHVIKDNSQSFVIIN